MMMNNILVMMMAGLTQAVMKKRAKRSRAGLVFRIDSESVHIAN